MYSTLPKSTEEQIEENPSTLNMDVNKDRDDFAITNTALIIWLSDVVANRK